MNTMTLTLNNKTGLHARPASMFVNVTKKSKSNVTIEKDGKSFDAKSILSILGLGLTNGDEVKITVEGSDEEVISNEIKTLFDNNFYEA